MKYTGKIITLAFPDTFVRLSRESLLEWMVKFRIVGKGDYIKAGHAALVLIENATGKAEYYDFGRYVTPPEMGRVRSAVTDVELEIPFEAIVEDGELKNLKQFLIWLEAHPEKTHGTGRMVCSVCDAIDYSKAREYIQQLHAKGSIPYKAFSIKGRGSNCSRLVTETILASTDQPKIRRYLLRNKSFTPSTVGNVEKAALKNPIYEVLDGEVKRYTRTAFKENMSNYFDKNIPLDQNKDLKVPEHLIDASYLSGTGCGAYFLLENETILEKDVYQIKRYNDLGELDFEGLFRVLDTGFNKEFPYVFVYDSNCSYCHIKQNERIFRFELEMRLM